MDKKSKHFLFHSESIAQETLVLGSDEVAHMINVLRFKEGDAISVTDGKGTIYSCTVEKLKKSNALCSIQGSTLIAQPKPIITAYIGLPDKDRMERVCEQLPPLNVTRIVPVINEHCRKPWWDTRWYKSEERFNRIIISSMKQSFNPYITSIEKPIPFSEAVAQASGTLLWGSEAGKKLSSFASALSSEELSLFIGPPGGFSDEEKSTFLEREAVPFNLGLYRLRTELAATTAVALLTELY